MITHQNPWRKPQRGIEKPQIYRATVTWVVEPTPRAITAKTRLEIVDTISFIGPLRVRFGATTQSRIPHRLCILQGESKRIKNQKLITLSTFCCKSEENHRIENAGVEDTRSPSSPVSPAATFHSGGGSGCDPSPARPYRSIVRTPQKGARDYAPKSEYQNEKFRSEEWESRERKKWGWDFMGSLSLSLSLSLSHTHTHTHTHAETHTEREQASVFLLLLSFGLSLSLSSFSLCLLLSVSKCFLTFNFYFIYISFSLFPLTLREVLFLVWGR